MSTDDSQAFLRELDKKLWSAADRLRANLDAAVYKHAVLGLIFLKYVSDSFATRQREIELLLREPASDYYLKPSDYGSDALYEEAIHAELEERDYYIEKNVFWVPALARWKTLQDSAPLPPGTEIEVTNGKKVIYKLTSIGKLIDDALDAVEKENPKLKNVLDKRYAQLQLPPESLIGLINLIATIPFEHADMHAKDILGHVYEYFLGQFALAEGKKGGQYFTPKSIVSLIVEMLEPYQGRVYDPAMGSGGFFVQSERFIEEHDGRLGNLSVYGQESNPTTWRLAAMNMAIRGIDFNFGKEPANSFTSDQHPDLRADYVMANPPFNISEWWDAKLEGDPRWKYGTPPKGNANFAWIQHMLHHLAPQGSMALLLANGSMSSGSGGEGQIRQALIEADLVECMVALPGQLFTNTQIPACIWFLTKDKIGRAGYPSRPSYRDRTGQILFIDARKLGYMLDRVLRAFTAEDLEKITGTFQKWKRSTTDYADIPGFCKSATLEEIAAHGFVLTPGRYVGAEDVEDDGEPFEEKMTRLVAELNGQFAESAKLEEAIKANLADSDMAGDWPAQPLEAVAELTGGFAFKSEDYSPEGRFVLRTLNIKDDGSIDRDSAVFLPLEKCALYKRFELQEHDTLFVMVGATLGKVGYVRREDLPALLNQNMWRIRGRDGLCDKRYLQYAFRHTVKKNLGWASGSARDFVRRDDYRTMEIPVPPLPEQEAIAAVLGALDDKIELNRRMNATLEAMARALFQSWIVDFDPVRAKAEGRPPAGLDEPTAALFPAQLQASELGEIPHGWAVSSIGDIAEVIDCLHAKKPERTNSGGLFLQLNNIRDNGLLDISDAFFISEPDYKKWVSRMEAKQGDCVITNVGRVGAIAQVPPGVNAALGRNMTGIRCKPDFNFPTFLAECLLSEAMREEIEKKKDTGTILDALNVKSIPSLRFFCPPRSIVNRFEALARPLRCKMEQNAAESRTLATLRDTLLPMLLSGELRCVGEGSKMGI